MKKEIVLVLLTAIFLISMVSAEVEYFQYKSYKGNNVFLDHMFFCYEGETNDYVSGGHDFEAYVQYDIYVQTFNSNNPSEPLDHCNITFKQGSPNVSVIYQQTFTSNSYDVTGGKYFFSMKSGECVMAQIYCQFEPSVNISTYPLDLDTAEDMQLVTPSWECKSCQKYEWTAQEQTSIKAESLSDHVIEVSNYIKQLFMLNLDIIFALFWLFLTAMLIFSVGFIFMGVYYLYMYLTHVIK